jgi:hypothetical protein
VNTYTPYVDVPNFRKQTLLYIKAQRDPNIIMVGNFNITFSPLNKVNEETDLNDIIDQMDLADIYRIFHPSDAIWQLPSNP